MEAKDDSKKLLPGLLANRTFLSLWTSQILTQIGIGVFTISMAILSDQGVLSEGLKGTSAGVGLIVVISNLPSLFLSGVGGVVVDWWDRKKIMIFSNLIRFAIIALFLLFRGWENIFLAYSVIIFMNVIQQFFTPAEGSTIPNVVDPKFILLANSLFSITLYSTYIFGIGGSGQFISRLGQSGTFAVIAGLFLAGTLVLLPARIPRREKVETPDLSSIKKVFVNIFNSWKQGLGYIRRSKIMKLTLSHIFIAYTAVLISVTIVFRIGRELFGVESHNIGPVIIIPAAIGVVLGFIVMNTIGKDRGRFRVINEGVFSVGMGVLMLAALSIFQRFAPDQIPFSFGISTLGVIFIAFGAPFLVIPAQALLHENTEEAFRGRVYSVWLTITQTLASVPAFFMGLLIDKVVDLYGFMILATLLVFGYAGTIYFIRRKI